MTEDSRLKPDVEEFWSSTIAESRERARPSEVTPHPAPMTNVDAFDVRFSGFGGQRIAAWLLLPAGNVRDLPVVVEYVGHGGGRGYAHEHLLWATSGFAHLVMDVRGQGDEWSIGATADEGPLGPGSGAFFTRGIEDRHSYYYRRLFTDGVLAIDALQSLPGVDLRRVAVSGTSQGGGVAVAVAGLRADVAALMADVPAFASHRAAIDAVEIGPYLSIANYLAVHRDSVDRVFDVLRFFDTADLGRAARAPALFSLGGRDDLVPAETIRDIASAYGGAAELIEYPYNGHEGGGALHDLKKVQWLTRLLVGGGGADR